MSKLKKGDKINLNVSGRARDGVAPGCSNFEVSFRIYPEKCESYGEGPPICSPDETKMVAMLSGKFDPQGKNATVTWTIDTKGVTTPYVTYYFIAAAGDMELTSKGTTPVATGLSGNKVYSCTYTKDGKKYHGCASKPEDAGSRCIEIPVNCDPNSCTQIDKVDCGKALESSVTHKACTNGTCEIVSGAGTDTCTTIGQSCGGSGGGGGGSGGGGGGGGGAPVTTQYVFNLPNPIGVTTFQDLINIIGKWIFNLAIPIAVIIIIWAGVLMLTSGGDAGRFKKGYMALWYAVIGLAIVLIGKGFVTLIQSILNLRNR